MMCFMGRPKMPLSKITKAAVWKRAQRASGTASHCSKCGKKVSGRNAHRAHVKKNGVKNGPGGTVTMCASCHMSQGRSRHEI